VPVAVPALPDRRHGDDTARYGEWVDDFDLDLIPAFALADPDSPDLCPDFTDLMNGLGGSSCDNATSGAGQAAGKPLNSP
jgi:hypothetical protein